MPVSAISPSRALAAGMIGKQRQGFLDGQVEHLGDIVAPGTVTASTSRLKRRP